MLLFVAPPSTLLLMRLTRLLLVVVACAATVCGDVWRGEGEPSRAEAEEGGASPRCALPVDCGATAAGWERKSAAFFSAAIAACEGALPARRCALCCLIPLLTYLTFLLMCTV